MSSLRRKQTTIRERIEPKRQEIRADEEQLARIEAAVDVLRGNVALATRSRTAPPRRRGSIDEEQIVAFVRQNQPVGAKQIGPAIGVTGNNLSVKLGRMVQKGLLTKTGERAGTRLLSRLVVQQSGTTVARAMVPRTASEQDFQQSYTALGGQIW